LQPVLRRSWRAAGARGGTNLVAYYFTDIARAAAAVRAKAKLEKRIAQERSDHKLTMEKLGQAWELVNEAARV
jgi:hypothetical protein